jgi:hypothetical protein
MAADAGEANRTRVSAAVADDDVVERARQEKAGLSPRPRVSYCEDPPSSSSTAATLEATAAVAGRTPPIVPAATYHLSAAVADRAGRRRGRSARSSGLKCLSPSALLPPPMKSYIYQATLLLLEMVTMMSLEKANAGSNMRGME